MKEKEIFALAVRILGLVFLYHGLSGIPESIARSVLFALDVKSAFSGAEWANAGYRLALGFWLVRGAPLLMSIAYPAKPLDQARA